MECSWIWRLIQGIEGVRVVVGGHGWWWAAVSGMLSVARLGLVRVMGGLLLSCWRGRGRCRPVGGRSSKSRIMGAMLACK